MKFTILEVEIDACTLGGAVATARSMVAEGTRGYIVFCTVSTILSAREDSATRRAVEDATLVTPDGMPLVWIGKRRQEAPITRVYGPDFMRGTFESAASELRHFFYGGAPGVADEVVATLGRDYPDVVVVGTHSPRHDLDPFVVDEEGVRLLNAAGPDIVWVGLGHPKQEIWMNTNRPHLDAPVLAGVGAAFDFLSGRKREAPAWMKRVGLQWLHRLASEPRRLWRRYLVGNALFLVLLVRERIGRNRRRRRGTSL